MARDGAGNSQCRPSIFDNRWAGPTVLAVDLGVCWGGGGGGGLSLTYQLFVLIFSLSLGSV